ncbi:hypothetical protein G7085_14535 [Tessaracoccus sp. HDW20]|uniref:type II secretion system F family protein n=1 Tax=Tessaracoccus coleopterorum TaxID=2714950 RepID=UPI0018D4C94D|nr:hypothetical protein [Tessaracoccus coleopterorum]NHB85424.1 hypothetical protein [Tessaracoccus coleopterorum]
MSERVGAPVADVLAGVSEAMRAEQRVSAVVEAELSAARTSGHIMAVLPFLAVGLGYSVGVDPLAFLTGGPLGQVLVSAGWVSPRVGCCGSTGSHARGGHTDDRAARGRPCRRNGGAAPPAASGRPVIRIRAGDRPRPTASRSGPTWWKRLVTAVTAAALAWLLVPGTPALSLLRWPRELRSSRSGSSGQRPWTGPNCSPSCR